MNKQEQKKFRTLVYEKHGAIIHKVQQAYMESLYPAPFEWVELETKAGWTPEQIWRTYFVKFNDMLYIINVFVATETMNMPNRILAAHTLCTFNHEYVRRLLSVGYTLEEVRDQLSGTFGKLYDFQQNALIELLCRNKHTGKINASALYMQQIGRGKRPDPVRGEPVMITQLKQERETIKGAIEKDRKAGGATANRYDEYREYRLLYLNRMIDGDKMGLRTFDIGDYKKLSELLGLKSIVAYAGQRDADLIRMQVRSTYTQINDVRIWSHELQKWIYPARMLKEIESVINYCKGLRATCDHSNYKEYTDKIIYDLASAWGVPVEKLTAPMPPVDPAIKERYRKVFGPHATPAIRSPYLDEIYKNLVIDPSLSNDVIIMKGASIGPSSSLIPGVVDYMKSKEFPGGSIVMGSASGAGKLRGINSKYVVYDCLEGGGDVIDWAKQFPLVHAAGGLDAIVRQWDEEAKLKTFTNTVLGEPYEPGKVIPLADWKKLAKASRELTLLSLDQIKEKYGLKERPTIAVAFALKLNDNFSSQINKIKTAMQNTTNAAGEMTKEQKRSRIKELEAGLETIKKHKAQIAQVEKTMREKPAATLRTILAVQNDGGHNFEQFTMFGQDFMKPEMMLKIYKVELDEEEARVNVELNKLIA